MKNKTSTLDEIDLEILSSLQENSNRPHTEIAERLGIAHSTVHERVRRMEQHGIIEKYTILINSEKLGTKNITALMTVYTDPKESDRVAEKLREASEVFEVYTSLSEELLIIARVVAEDQEQLHNFVADYVAPMPGVLRIRTSIITKKYKEIQSPALRQIEKVHLLKEQKHIEAVNEK